MSQCNTAAEFKTWCAKFSYEPIRRSDAWYARNDAGQLVYRYDAKNHKIVSTITRHY